jgi:hypothetical protein
MKVATHFGDVFSQQFLQYRHPQPLEGSQAQGHRDGGQRQAKKAVR